MAALSAVLWSAFTAAGAIVAFAQRGSGDGQWREYGSDAGSTRYSTLDQINEKNVKDLKIAWRWKSQNFGRRPDFNWEVTPLMIRGVL
ncbi:MAG: pyrroloquinoline quinone-dependent dehydrogenase, partial [Candidatus Solibacter sp.]